MGILDAPTQKPQPRKLIGTLSSQGTTVTPTLYGYGWPIGNPSGLNQVTLVLRGGATSPTQVRLVIKQTNSSGAVLAESVVQPASISSAAPYTPVTFNLGAPLNAAAGQLWAEVYFDQPCFPVEAASILYAPSTYPMALYTSSATAAVSTQWGGGSMNFYAEFYYDPGCTSQTFPNGSIVSSTKTYPYETSTFNGWAFPLAAAKNFNRVEFEIRQWSQEPITRVRVRILDGSDPTTAQPLTDQTINVSCARGVQKTVTVDLPMTIANPTGDQLWVEWRCDGYTSFRAVPTPANVLKPYYFATTFDITASTTPSQDSSLEGAYVRYSLVDNSQALAGGTSPFQAQVQTISQQPWLAITSSLPANIYAATGRECNVYWDAFLRAAVPLSHYTFSVACSKGEQDEHRWFFTPVDGDAGTYTWTLSVYFAAQLVATFTTTLNIVAAAAGTGVTRKLVSIGDSTTQLGYHLAELINLFSADAMAVTEVGSISASVADSGGASRTIHHDGVSGKTVNYFATDPASPFVYSSTFNFATYLSTFSITLTSSDWVMIHLGINDFFSQTTDATVQLAIRTALKQLATMITSIKAAVAGIRIGLLLTIPPARSQDAFGINYATAEQQWRYARNQHLWREGLMLAYDGGGVANVSVLPYHLNLDTLNNMQRTSTVLNARNATLFSKASNGVHPATNGFYQMADSLYSIVKNFA